VSSCSQLLSHTHPTHSLIRTHSYALTHTRNCHGNTEVGQQTVVWGAVLRAKRVLEDVTPAHKVLADVKAGVLCLSAGDPKVRLEAILVPHVLICIAECWGSRQSPLRASRHLGNGRVLPRRAESSKAESRLENLVIGTDVRSRRLKQDPSAH
jgi:hypothetical protein